MRSMLVAKLSAWAWLVSWDTAGELTGGLFGGECYIYVLQTKTGRRPVPISF